MPTYPITMGSGPTSELKSNTEQVVDIAAAYKGNPKWYEAYGLTPALLRKVIDKYAYYSGNGLTIAKNAGNIVADIKRETGVLLNTPKVANAIGTMDMAMQSFARKYPNDFVVRWWKTGQNAVAAVAADTKKAAKSAVQKTTETLNEIKSGAASAVESLVPWYLRPKTIIFAAAGLGAVYLLLPRMAQAGVAAFKQARK